MKRLISLVLASLFLYSNTALAVIPISPPPAGRAATYSFVTQAYVAYATPTDMFGICGSDTKTVAVFQMLVAVNSTAAALQTFYFLRRSTADSGGTVAHPTPSQNDALDPAPTATVSSYTAAPTLGTALYTLRIVTVMSAVLTGTPNFTGIYNQTNFINPGYLLMDYRKPITLHGSGDCLYANYNGAALTAGFTANIDVEWIEY